MPAVLFVCTGNICRSPFAERYARHLANRAGGTGWRFDSAGTGALVGFSIDAPMARELSAVGGDPNSFSARAISPTIVNSADWIITLTDNHRRDVLEDFPGRVTTMMTLGRLAATVPALDPDLRGEDLLRAVGRTRRAPEREHDVPDPYRRGDAAAATAAAAIVGYLDAIAPRLF